MKKHAVPFLACALLLAAPVRSQDVLTQHNDNARTGSYTAEKNLTPAKVRSGFGKLFARSVVGSVYAQPLYASNVEITGRGSTNAIFVATMHNLVYAFDADGQVEEPLWDPVSLGSPAPLPDICIGPTSGATSTYHDVAQEIGIMSTPVISRAQNALFAVAFSKDATSGTYSYSLNKIDLSSGSLTSSEFASSTCNAATSGPPGFQVNRQNQRPGLLLDDGKIYVGFAAFGDESPWQGWVLGFDSDTLAPLQRSGQQATYRTSSSGAGIWMSGNGLAADDDHYIYFSTGNGSFDPTTASDLAESIIKLDPALERKDWFAPCNTVCLNGADADLSSAGVLLIPDPSGGKNLLVGGGKEGKLYLLDRDQFGTSAIPNFSCTDEQIEQSLCVVGYCGQCCSGSDSCSGSSCSNRPTCSSGGKLRGSPVYWQSSEGQFVYVWPQKAAAQAYQLTGGMLGTQPTSHSTDNTNPPYPGGLLSISANGDDPSSGILWATLAVGNANQQVVPGIAYAYDASDLSQELWNSQSTPGDHLGNFAKFPPPTVANGTVYVGTLGLLQDTPSTGAQPTGGAAVANLNDDKLAVAWTDTGGNLQMACSDEPLQWVYGDGVDPVSPGGTSPKTPALTGGGNLLYLAWTDSSQQLHVQNTGDCQSFSKPVAVNGETSKLGPALAFGSGTLYLAWTGTDSRLNVISSTDGGMTFDNKVTLPETSGARPGLAYFDSTLFLTWSGTDGRGRLNILESADGVHFGQKHLLDIFSNEPPALAETGVVNFMWTDVNGILNHAATTRSFMNFANEVTYGTTNGTGPSLTTFRDVLWVGWSGVQSGTATVHVAPWKPPQVVAYGLK